MITVVRRPSTLLLSWWDHEESVYHDVELYLPSEGAARALAEVDRVNVQLRGFTNTTFCMKPLPAGLLSAVRWRPYVDALTCPACSAGFDLCVGRMAVREPVNLRERPVLA